jgi:hypothetical protein
MNKKSSRKKTPTRNSGVAEAAARMAYALDYSPRDAQIFCHRLLTEVNLHRLAKKLKDWGKP